MKRMKNFQYSSPADDAGEGRGLFAFQRRHFVNGTWSEMRNYCHKTGGDTLKLDDANLIYDIHTRIE